MAEDLLKQLNAKQREAVTQTDGPALIVAGAGTGKTTVLISRLAYLITEKKVPGDEILLLTFTEKAAGEMEERADKALPYGYFDLWISTFHGLGERLLREHALDIGLSANFKLLTETEQWGLIKKNLDQFDLDYYRPLGSPTKFISELVKHFSRLKDENISPAEYLAYAEGLEDDADSRLNGGAPAKRKGRINKIAIEAGPAIEASRIKELANAYHTYNQLLLGGGYLDFGDLITYSLKLFRERPNILKQYQEKFRYIMVDEFQDTNWAQYELIKLLAEPSRQLMVVGDDDQAIYKFRGASLSNIMQFQADYPEAKHIVLTENYRSRQAILDRAHDFIKHNNPYRLEEKLSLDKRLLAKGRINSEPESADPVSFSFFFSARDEVAFVAGKIKALYQAARERGEEIGWLDFAILVRANDSAEAFVKELGRQNIPRQFMSWRGLYYKPLILDILAYFRLLDNYHESSALFRVLNMAAFRLGQAEMVEINRLARKKAWSTFEALKNAASVSSLSQESLGRINKLLSLIEGHSQLVAREKPTKIFLHFAYDSGLIAGLDQDRDLESFSYLNQFYQKLKQFEDKDPDARLGDFLEAMNLELEAGETGSLKLDFADHDTVKIMTVHGAKGLEFRYVFLVNLVDKKFPTITRGEKLPIPDQLVKEKGELSPDSHLQEERRLFYVAATRAKDALFLSGAKDYGGQRAKQPSRFISEMGLNADGETAADMVASEFLAAAAELANPSPAAELAALPLPEKYSFSQLAAFSSCPLQYKFAFILRIPPVADKASLVFGQTMHEVLQAFLRPLVSQSAKQGELFIQASSGPDLSRLSEKRLFDLYEEIWQNDGYASQAEREAYRSKGRQALKRFWEDFQASPPAGIIFLEKNFTFKLGEDAIKGTIDRIDVLPDGRLEIIDYKTGQAKEKLGPDDKRQLILYQIFMEEFLDQPVGRLTYYYLESGQRFSFLPTDKEKAAVKAAVLADIGKIKSRQFPPKPSPLCRFCDFNGICEFRQA